MNFKVSENEEEVNYDYDFSFNKKKSELSSTRRRFDDEDDDGDFEMEDSSEDIIKSNPKKSVNSPHKVITNKKEISAIQSSLGSINSNESALEKAQQMLSKYSNKSFTNKNNDYKVRKFDEDNLSVDSDENDDDYSEFEESEFSSGNKRGSNSADINELGKQKSIAIDIGEFEEEDNDNNDNITPYSFPVNKNQFSTIKEKQPPSNTKHEGIKQSKTISTDSNDYSEENFDQSQSQEIDESISIKESLTIEDSKPPKAKTTISTAPTTSSNNIYTDENSDYENNSYSRIPYGNEGNESEEESEEEGDLSSSRPKILSFAELSAQTGWTSAKNSPDRPPEDDKQTGSASLSMLAGEMLFSADKSSSILKIKKETIPQTIQQNNNNYNKENTKNNNNNVPNNTMENITVLPISNNPGKKVESTISNPQVNNNNNNTTNQYHPIPSYIDPNNNNGAVPPPSYPNSYPQPNMYYQNQHPPHFQQQQQQQHHHHQQQQQQPNGTPPPYPYMYNLYPSYYPYPPPSMYPPMPPNMSPYFYPPFPGQYAQSYPMQNNNYNNQQVSANNIGRFSTGSLEVVNNSTSLSLAQQPLLLDLLQELRKTKEEADWAKQKLAETIMLISKKDKEIQKMEPIKTTTVINNEKQNLHFKKDTKNMRDRYSNENAPDEDYYSSDFEESILNKSSTSSKNSSPVKKKSVSSKNDKVEIESNVPEPIQESLSPILNNNNFIYASLNNNTRPSDATKETPALQPLRESLAQSLSSSQGLFKSQLDSLKMRLQMTNSIDNNIWLGVNSSSESKPIPSAVQSSYRTSSSLSELQKEFNLKREENNKKIFEIISRAYPNMDTMEAILLAERFQ